MKLAHLLQRIDQFYIKATTAHYAVDTSKINDLLEMRNDQDLQKESLELYQHYDVYDYQIVPIHDIEEKPIWSKEKFEIVLEKMNKKELLPPVELLDTPERQKLTITDGIHRIAASKNLGFSYVPAIIQHYSTKPLD